MQVQEFVDDKKRHLPRFLRDFHDQKAVFKAAQWWRDKFHSSKQNIDWMAGHIYVIDTFLRFMAYHGYTLQKTRVKVDAFADIHETIREMDEEQIQQLKDYFSSTRSQPQCAETSP